MKLDLELDLKIARKAWVPLSGSPFETTGSDRHRQGLSSHCLSRLVLCDWLYRENARSRLDGRDTNGRRA